MNSHVPVEKIFPVCLITLDFLASIVYLSQTNIKLAVYWLAAGVLTICVMI